MRFDFCPAGFRYFGRQCPSFTFPAPRAFGDGGIIKSLNADTSSPDETTAVKMEPVRFTLSHGILQGASLRAIGLRVIVDRTEQLACQSCR